MLGLETQGNWEVSDKIVPHFLTADRDATFQGYLCLMLIKIVIIGPESTGKSTLCQQLAIHYNSAWSPEYARQHLLKFGNKYTYEDLLTIAKGQLAMESDGIFESIDKNNPVLFIDTDMYVIKVWCEFVFGKCHKFILDKIVERKYDLYLLCNTDLPWVKDELREYPDLDTRNKLFFIYKDLMINQSVPWVEISGNNDERLTLAIQAVDKRLAVET